VFAQDCASGQSCVLEDAPGANSCVTAGRGTLGQACDSVDGCQPGLQCAGLAGSDPTSYWFAVHATYIGRGGVCLQLCHPGDDAACGSGQACAHISSVVDGSARTDAGVCYQAR
jgi:hypothetical protein